MNQFCSNLFAAMRAYLSAQTIISIVIGIAVTLWNTKEFFLISFTDKLFVLDFAFEPKHLSNQKKIFLEIN